MIFSGDYKSVSWGDYLPLAGDEFGVAMYALILLLPVSVIAVRVVHHFLNKFF